MVLAAEPFKEGADGGELNVLVSEGERLAVGFAVVEEMALVALKHEPSDLGGVGDAALFEPVEKVGDVEIGIADRARGVVAGALPIEIRCKEWF